jgi:hypothetical protein
MTSDTVAKKWPRFCQAGGESSSLSSDSFSRSSAASEGVSRQPQAGRSGAGIVEAFNIDNTGREELIDQQQLAAAQFVTLGPYEFVNVKGSETLRVNLRPCVGNAGGAASRGLVRAQIRPELAAVLLNCEDPALNQQKTAARGITKVAVEGGTNFALDPVSRSEIASGQIAPREVSIRFQHQ